MFDAECDEIDSFVASYKTLRGLLPDWTKTFAQHWQARWAIVDQHDIERGDVCFSMDYKHENPSLCCIVKKSLIYRLDVVPFDECKDNPLSALALNLPFRVCGPHVHGWSENREYVRVNGFRELPNRRLIGGVVVTIADALAWLTTDLNIGATPEQRVCHMPPEKGLL